MTVIRAFPSYDFARACLFGAVTLVCAFASGAGPANAQSKPKGSPQPVVVAEARLDRFVDRVQALGTTRANETVAVTANITEKVVAIHFDDGQAVAAGDILVTLQSDEMAANLKAAEAVLTERLLAFDRAKKLESQKFTSTAQMEERRAALRQAEAEVAAIQARLADRVIRAPFAGTVGLRNISLGTLVKPGDVIATLHDLSVMKVDFSVPAIYLSTLRPGLPIVTKTPAFDTRAFEGEIRSLASEVDPVTRSIVARAIVPNPDGVLRPGLLMTVDLLKNPRQAVVIPEEALVPSGRQTFVFLVDKSAGNKVVKREIRTGARRPGEVEILAGLEPGDQVITRGTLQVRAGQTVEVMAVEQPGQALEDVLRKTPES
jgi:membrane fusion protein (multidrug efflux system)